MIAEGSAEPPEPPEGALIVINGVGIGSPYPPEPPGDVPVIGEREPWPPGPPRPPVSPGGQIVTAEGKTEFPEPLSPPEPLGGTREREVVAVGTESELLEPPAEGLSVLIGTG